MVQWTRLAGDHRRFFCALSSCSTMPDIGWMTVLVLRSTRRSGATRKSPSAALGPVASPEVVEGDEVAQRRSFPR